MQLFGSHTCTHVKHAYVCVVSLSTPIYIYISVYIGDLDLDKLKNDADDEIT